MNRHVKKSLESIYEENKELFISEEIIKKRSDLYTVLTESQKFFNDEISDIIEKSFPIEIPFEEIVKTENFLNICINNFQEPNTKFLKHIEVELNLDGLIKEMYISHSLTFKGDGRNKNSIQNLADEIQEAIQNKVSDMISEEIENFIASLEVALVEIKK